MMPALRIVRLSLAVVFGTCVLFGLGFAVGAVAGLTYTARDKTCALVESNGATVPVCEYDYHPPKLWATW